MLVEIGQCWQSHKVLLMWQILSPLLFNNNIITIIITEDINDGTFTMHIQNAHSPFTFTWWHWILITSRRTSLGFEIHLFIFRRSSHKVSRGVKTISIFYDQSLNKIFSPIQEGSGHFFLLCFRHHKLQAQLFSNLILKFSYSFYLTHLFLPCLRHHGLPAQLFSISFLIVHQPSFSLFLFNWTPVFLNFLSIFFLTLFELDTCSCHV